MFAPSGTDIPQKYRRRREIVFLVLAGIFLGSLTMLNILGVTKFIDLSFDVGGLGIPFILPVGVLAYPITFLCTDLTSELFGRKRASLIVWVGLFLNLWVFFILWLGGVLPPQPEMDTITGLPSPEADGYVFYQVRLMTFSTITASMVAYLSAQFCDVYIFHLIKRLTKGRMAWLRNNGSTLISQLVDSTAVILITHYYANVLPLEASEPLVGQLISLIFATYVFKLFAALADTIPFYAGIHWLAPYLGLEPYKEEIPF